MSVPKESSAITYGDAMDIVYTTVSLTFETLFYGIYLVLMPFTVRVLVNKGTKGRANRAMLVAIFFPFVLSSLYWMLDIALQIARIEQKFLHPGKLNDDPHVLNYYTALFNAIISLNYVFTDGVVVWRAWALCRAEYPKLLFIPVMFLALTTISVLAIIAIRIALLLPLARPESSCHRITVRTLDFLQVTGVAWSLLTNVTSTLIITHKTWRHRVLVYDDLRQARGRGTRAERVLAIVIETGILYCISGATVLAAAFIHMPGSGGGTLGDIYTPINVQISSIYPTIVIVVVALERSLNKTTFWQQSTTAGAAEHRDDPAQLDERTHSDMRFAADLDAQNGDTDSFTSARGKPDEQSSTV